MHVASILPQAYLHLTEQDDYHLALAHLIGAPGYEKYTKFYREASREGAYVILDNGLIETGAPLPIEELVRRGLICSADEIILPDVFRDRDKTFNSVDYALNYIKANENYVGDFTFMAIPQGDTLENWLCCAEELLEHPLAGYIKVLGIPKVLVDIAGRDGRLKALSMLMKKRPEDCERLEFHLLGCWTTPIEIMAIGLAERQELIPQIRGVDSAIAYVYARAGIRFNDSDRPDSNPIDFRDGKLESTNETLLHMNLRAWRETGDISRPATIGQKILYFLR